MKHLGCKEDQRRTPEDQRGEFVASDDEEVSDDERHTVNTILAKSRHCDGSMYRVDTWWKEFFFILRTGTRVSDQYLF